MSFCGRQRRVVDRTPSSVLPDRTDLNVLRPVSMPFEDTRLGQTSKCCLSYSRPYLSLGKPQYEYPTLFPLLNERVTVRPVPEESGSRWSPWETPDPAVPRGVPNQLWESFQRSRGPVFTKILYGTK